MAIMETMMREILGGCFVSEPLIHPDDRGTFHEWFKASDFENAVGYPFDLQQANVSTSKAGVLRGLHYADVPPGQAKFVGCLSGRIIDVVVDIREGSETFGKWEAVELSSENRKSIYIPIGFAHGFVALEDSTVAYLTSAEYTPGAEHEINAFDPAIGIEWPEVDFIMSEKDRNAPALADAPLPKFEDCQDFETMLKDGWVVANQEASQ